MDTRCTVRVAIGAAALLLLGVAVAEADVAMEGDAQSRLERLVSIVFAENDSGVVALPDDGSTGVWFVQNSHLYAGGVACSHLSNAAIGAASGVSGTSGSSTHPNSGFVMVADGNARFFDELSVTSSTLPIGADVTIVFSYHIDYDDFYDVTGTGSRNHAMVRTTVSSNLRSKDENGGDFASAYVSPGDHRRLVLTASGVNIADGLFAGAQHLDVTIPARVGGTIEYVVTLDADTSAGVGKNDGFDQFSTALSSAGLAFGASQSGARSGDDVVLISARLGGPFPAAALANAAHAADGRPSAPAPCPGDATGDMLVNFDDLNAVLEGWNTTGPIGDVDGSGFVDFDDLNLVLENWGAAC